MFDTVENLTINTMYYDYAAPQDYQISIDD